MMRVVKQTPSGEKYVNINDLELWLHEVGGQVENHKSDHGSLKLVQKTANVILNHVIERLEEIKEPDSIEIIEDALRKLDRGTI